jgi:thioredoxin reductase
VTNREIEPIKTRIYLTKQSCFDSLSLAIPLAALSKYHEMVHNKTFDVIIVGGSYAGLSAAMALGRSLKSVLIVDSGEPCNKQTPHSHNFLTQDGATPKEIADLGKTQVLKYKTVKFINGIAIKGQKEENLFIIELQTGDIFKTRKVLFATGVKDLLPEIKGISECWGISVLHCPYCHGYEVKNAKIGLLGNGDLGFELSRLINNWTNDLMLFTNGVSTLTSEQTNKITGHKIKINEKVIRNLEHKQGYLEKIVFMDGTTETVTALFARGGFKQHCEIPIYLGCEVTEQGYIKIDDFQRTTVHGIFAAGDTTTMFRAVSAAVAAGNKAGAVVNKELIDETF